MSSKAPLSASISQAFLNSYTQSGGLPLLSLSPTLYISCTSSHAFLSHLQIPALLFLSLICIYHCIPACVCNPRQAQYIFPYMTHDNFLICSAFSTFFFERAYCTFCRIAFIFPMTLTVCCTVFILFLTPISTIKELSAQL